MKYRVILLFIWLAAFLNPILAWGEEGHALIARKATALLPEEMGEFKKWSLYLEEHSSDPDKRKGEDKSEGPKHYIDIDFYTEFHSGNMVTDIEILRQKYSDSVVTAMGLLPWATIETYKNLVQAFRDKNRDRVLIYAADLAHYVADGHQPMHTILNYDGQLSGQKGIHARYEIYMVNRYLQELDSSFIMQTPFYTSDPLNYIFFYITNANMISEVLYQADKEAYNRTGSRDSDDYYRLLWFRTKYVTVLQMNNAAYALGSLYYSAWTDAGNPNLTEIE
jgi:hypothetical protein